MFRFRVRASIRIRFQDSRLCFMLYLSNHGTYWESLQSISVHASLLNSMRGMKKNILDNHYNVSIRLRLEHAKENDLSPWIQMLFGNQLELEWLDVAVIKMSIDWSGLYPQGQSGSLTGIGRGKEITKATERFKEQTQSHLDLQHNTNQCYIKVIPLGQ